MIPIGFLEIQVQALINVSKDVEDFHGVFADFTAHSVPKLQGVVRNIIRLKEFFGVLDQQSKHRGGMLVINTQFGPSRVVGNCLGIGS